MKNSRKHILFLCSWFPNREKPLEGNFILKHALFLQKFADVHICFSKSSLENKQKYELEKEVIEGVQVTKVYYRGSRLPVFKKIINLRRYMKAMKMAYATKQKSFDFAHVNVAFPAGLFALYLKRKMQLPYVITEHWSGYLPVTATYQTSAKFIKNIHQKIFRQAKQVFTVSNSLGNALQNHDLIKDFEVLPNYINVDVFKPQERKASVFTFIHVSTVDESTKNFSGILKALQNLKENGLDFKFNLVVEANPAIVKSKLDEYNLASLTNLYSYLPSDKVAELMRDSHSLIQFSNFETFSIVLAEAWLTGLPCVYSKCGGLTDLEDEKLGIQVSKGDVNELTEALTEMVNGYEKYSSEEIQKYSKKILDPENIFRTYEHLFR